MRIANKLTSLALLLAAPGLMAQESMGVLMGNIRDNNGKTLAGVTVKITSPNLLGERVQVTGADGAFRAPMLPPGNYTVVANLSNYVSQKANFYLSSGNTMRQDLILRPITQAAAVVEVVASVAQVDKSDTSTKTNFSADDLEAITGFPSSGSIAYNTMTLAPGVVGNVQYASVRGGGQMATNYVVNGISARDNVTGQARMGDYTLDDTIEDTSVIQSPLNAKYGGSSSGLVAITTKRGTNEFSGTIRAKLSNLAWAATRTGFRNNLGNLNSGTSLPQADDLSRTYELTFSGPIWKDHLTFLYATRLLPSVPNSETTFDPKDYKLTHVRIPVAAGVNNAGNYAAEMYQAGTIESATQKNTFHQFALFFQVNADHSLEWNYSEGNDTNPDLQYNYVTPDSTITKVQTSNRSYYNLAYRGILGANQLVEVRYGRNRSDTQFTSGPGTPILTMAGPIGMKSIADVWDDGAVYGYNNTNMTHYGWFTKGGASDQQPDGRTTESIVANYNVQLEAKGSHNIDIGFERQQPIWATTARGNSYPDQFFTAGQITTDDTLLPVGQKDLAGKYVMFNHNQAVDGAVLDFADYSEFFPQYQQYVGADQSKVRNPTDSLWINDQWTINNNWSVMGGLRYDNMKIKDATGTRVNTSMTSPRFEVKWDVNGDQKRLVNLSYGQFRGLYSARFYRTFTEGRRNTEIISYWNKGAGAFTEADVTNKANYTPYTFYSSGMFKMDNKWKPECNTEVVLGYTRQYDTGGHWKMAAVYRKWTDLTYIPGDPHITELGAEGTNLTTTSFIRTLTNDPDGHRFYKGFEFEWLAPLTADLMFGGNYVFSRTTANNDFGDATGFTALETPTLAGFWRPQFDKAGISRDIYMPDGQTALSRNHVLKAYLTYKLDRGRTKSSVALQGSYYAGGHSNLTNSQSLTNAAGAPVVLVPVGLGEELLDVPPTSFTRYFNGRGQYSQPDYWTLNLQYNLEIKLAGTTRVFTNLSVNNLLNSLLPGAVTYSASSATRSYAALQNMGYRAGATAAYGTTTGNTTTTIYGSRSVSLDLGVKF